MRISTCWIGVSVAMSVAFALASTTEATPPCPQPVLVESTPPIDNESDFGAPVAISGNTLVVGAPSLTNGISSVYGGAYVYTRSSDAAPWVLQQTLVPSAGPATLGPRWGHALAIDGNTIALGGDRVGPDNEAVCIYTRSGSTWTERTQIVGGPSFGSSVAIEGTTLVVGCPTWPFDIFTADPEPGAVFVYTGSGATWTLQDRIDSPVDLNQAGFGHSVAISGTTIATGIRKSFDPPGDDYYVFGAVSLYSLNGSQWDHQQTVQPIDQIEDDEFGSSIALRGNTLLVGAPNDPRFLPPYYPTGSAFVFTRIGSTWSQYSRISPIDSESHNRFARSVALGSESFAAISSGDHRYISRSMASVALTFELSGGLWLQRHECNAPVPESISSNRLVSQSVCVSGTATEATVVGGVVDTPYNTDSYVGRVHTFATTTGGWTRQHSMTEPRFTGSRFGSAAAVQEDILVVGAPNEDVGELAEAGTVRVRAPSDFVYGFWQKLIASDAASFDHFGGATAIDGDTVAVGAIGDNNANGTNAGAVYIFSPSSGLDPYAWVETQKIIAPDGAAADGFGNAVAVRGSTLLIGASGDDNASGTNAGAVYFYSLSGTTWTYQRKIGPSDLASGDEFGRSIAIAGFPGISVSAAAVIGAHKADVSGRADAGAAYIFAPTLDLSGTTWTQRAKLTATDNAAGDNFGASVALWNDGTAVVGSALDDHATGTDAGSAYVFGPVGAIPSISSWTQRAKLVSTGGLAGDRFGAAVSVAPNLIAVGAPQHGIFDEGGAYLFVRDSGVWTQRRAIFGPNPVLLGDTFGAAVSLSDGRLAIGSPLENSSGGTDAGAIYLYDVVYCSANFDCNDSVDVTDLFGFLDAWFAQSGVCMADCSADFDGNNTVDVVDLFGFLDAWFAQNGVCG